MKLVSVLIMLILIAGCAPGMHARSGQVSEVQNQKANEVDAFEPDDGGGDSKDDHSNSSSGDNGGDSETPHKTPKQLEFDFGQNQLTVSNDDLSSPALLKPTIYYLPTNDVAPFKSCSSSDIRSIKALNDKDLVPGKNEIRVCSKFYFEVEMEGSGIVKLNDGRELLINYVGMQDDEPRFQVVNRDTCPYGLGKQNLCLQPFISVAADPNHYNVGDVIYVPAVAQAKIRLPDGDIHRGFFIVADGGGAINGVGRFDFYTGPLDVNRDNPLEQIGLQSRSNTTHLVYQRVKRGSQTEKAVLNYYKNRQIIPYN